MGVGAHRLIDGNRMGADSCAPVGPAAASGPGFHIRWPPSGPRVSARAIPVSVDGRGPPADARVPRFTMNFFSFGTRFCARWPAPYIFLSWNNFFFQLNEF